MGRRQHQTILWIALAMGLPLRPVIAQQAPAQMAGAVVDASTGVSVAGADILHLGDRRKVMSDSLGKYLFDSLPPGIVRFVVRSPGFPPTMVTVALAAGEKMARDIELDSTSVGRRAAQNLPRVAIEALSAPTPRFRDFERRRLTGRGQYLGREDIERSNFASLLDSIRGLR